MKRSIVIALAATLALALPVTAQEAGESAAPDESAAPGAETPGVAFPVMLGGQLLTPQTYSGEEWLAQFDDGDEANEAYIADTETLIENAGATLQDVTVKTAMYEPAAGEAAVVLALRIDGTEARTWIEDAVDLLVADLVEPGLLLRPLDTKWTLRVTDAAMPGVYPRTVYVMDDTAWIIQGDDDYVWDALSQLPDADVAGADIADSLIADIPMTLAGERRVALYESVQPLDVGTLSERIGDEFWDWLLDLYLEAGLDPAQMLGAIAWWGVVEGIQIEGYRLPEGAEELTQRLLDEVFLIRPPEVSIDPEAPVEEPISDIAAYLQDVVFGEEEIAGQAVTTLDYGGPLQYIYGSGDTIWVISDPLGQRDRVEEAIEAMP